VNGCYKPVYQPWDWYSAGQLCQSLHKDAHLVVIKDVAEQLAVVKMINSANG